MCFFNSVEESAHSISPFPSRSTAGDISWSPPADASRVALYRAFLASDATGGGRSQIGEERRDGRPETYGLKLWGFKGEKKYYNHRLKNVYILTIYIYMIVAI